MRLTTIRNLSVGTTIDIVADGKNARCAIGKLVNQSEDWNSTIPCTPKSMKSSSFGKKVLVEIVEVINGSLIVPFIKFAEGQDVGLRHFIINPNESTFEPFRVLLPLGNVIRLGKYLSN